MVNNNIFLGSGASTTLIPEQDIYLPCTGSGTTTTLTPESAFTSIYTLVPDIYVGCTIDIYDDNDTLLSSHSISSNTKTAITLGSTPTAATSPQVVQYAIIRGYGAPAPHPLVSTDECLVSDNWLGIMESVTFPNLSQELKQMNLGLGGSRNFTFQYKGIRTADNGSLALVANTGSWLYYAFGSMTSINFVGAGNTVEYNSSSKTVDISIAGGGGGGLGTAIKYSDEATSSPFSYIDRTSVVTENLLLDTTKAGESESIIVSVSPNIEVVAGAAVTVGAGKTMIIDVLQIGDL